MPTPEEDPEVQTESKLSQNLPIILAFVFLAILVYVAWQYFYPDTPTTTPFIPDLNYLDRYQHY